MTFRQIRLRRRTNQQLVMRLPEAIDVARLVVSAGGNLTMVVQHLARWAPPPIGPRFEEVALQVCLGATMTESLEQAANTLGTDGAPLMRAFIAAERYGVAVAPLLDRVRSQAELARATTVERAVRRVPVLALFPLTICILPAFVLLTVIPLLAGALDGLGGSTVP